MADKHDNQPDTLKKRYFFKLINNVIYAFLGLLTAGLIPRMLGPREYGNFKYLLYNFTQITSFIGTGNNYLLTRLAKNNYNKGLVSFYWSYIIIAEGLLILLLIISSYTGSLKVILPGQELSSIWFILFLVIVQFFGQILIGVTDACGLTKLGSLLNISTKIFSVCCLIIFFFILKWYSIYSVFTYYYIMWVPLIIVLVWMLLKHQIPIINNTSWGQIKLYWRPFIRYSGPLFLGAAFVVPFNLANRWLLQTFGGSVEQGYFSLSNSISSFIIMFPNALSPLLLREFSIFNSKKDTNRLQSLYKRSIYFLFALSAYFSVFLYLQAPKITIWMGGASYREATLPVSIMIFYAIPYTTNNVVTAFFYSTNKTALLTKIVIISNIFILLLIFFFIAPSKYFGLNMGASGYAIAMVSSSVIIYIIYLRYSLLGLHLSLAEVITNHFTVILVFFSVAIVFVYLSDFLLNNKILSFIVSGFLYSLGILLIAKKSNRLFGFSINELIAPFKKIK